jgi:hypothetical protein
MAWLGYGACAEAVPSEQAISRASTVGATRG